MRMHIANERHQQNSHKWQTWQLGFQWQWRGFDLVFKSLDCSTMRLFHSTTIVWLLHVADCWDKFFPFSFFWYVCVCAVYLELVCVCVYLLFGAVYGSLGRRTYFGVSNVALVHMGLTRACDISRQLDSYNCFLGRLPENTVSTLASRGQMSDW